MTSAPLAKEKPSELPQLRALVAEDLAQVNQLIITQGQSEIALINDLAKHIIAAGGKRLRPSLTIAAAKLCGYEGERHMRLAACVEFIHTATLLHDDVVDESALRRGSATANAVWGNKASVLVGDFLSPAEEIGASFSAIAAEGQILMIADPIEETFPFAGHTEFLELASERRMRAPRAEDLREAYLARLAAHRAEVRAAALRRGWDLAMHRTDQPPATALLGLVARLSGRTPHHAVTGN